MSYFAIVKITPSTDQQVADPNVAAPDNAAVFLHDASDNLVSQGSASFAADGSATVKLENIQTLGDYKMHIAYRAGATEVSSKDDTLLARSAVPVPGGFQIVS